MGVKVMVSENRGSWVSPEVVRGRVGFLIFFCFGGHATVSGVLNRGQVTPLVLVNIPPNQTVPRSTHNYCLPDMRAFEERPIVSGRKQRVGTCAVADGLRWRKNCKMVRPKGLSRPPVLGAIRSHRESVMRRDHQGWPENDCFSRKTVN